MRGFSMVLVGVVCLAGCGDNLPENVSPDACAASWYADRDGDGFGDPDVRRRACDAPQGFVDDATDCDDGAAGTHPGASEVCGNGVDDDCAEDGDTLCSSELDGWTITAGRVVPGSTPALLTATVTFTKISGTATTRGGGACLLADLVPRGIGAATCTTDADCIAAAQTVFGSDGYGYCASPDGSGEPKQCWTRPGNFCVRSPANPEGEKTLTEVSWDVGGLHVPVRWILLGCMAEEATATACGGGDSSKYVRSTGPATTFP